MDSLFTIRTLPSAAGSTQPEQMGSKEKFWLYDAEAQERLLIKFPRSGTGEHWSEKIAAEIANALGIPHANVDLGRIDERAISVTKSFLKKGQALIHGNELLFDLDPTYPAHGNNYRARAHTVEAVYDALSRGVLAPASETGPGTGAFGVFVGYLLLDALVGNTDRHHENWAVIARKSETGRILEIAPSYDHASSLGRELSDEKKRNIILISKDHRRGVAAYCAKARSAFYPDDPGAGKRPFSCLEAFERGCELDPSAANWWMDRTSKVGKERLAHTVRRVPLSCMSTVAQDFAIALLEHNFQTMKDRSP